MSQIKILIDGRTIKNNPSGLGVWNLQLVSNLLKNINLKIYLLISQNCTYNFRLNSNLASSLGKNLILIKANHNYKFVSFERFVFEQWQLRHIISKYKIDLYHATDSFGIPASLQTSVKVILTIHDLIPLTPYREYVNTWQLLLYKLSLNISTKRANKICAISEKTHKDIQNYLHVPSQKLTVIYDGIDETYNHPKAQLDQTFTKLAKQHKIVSKKYLLYYGGFGSRRNVPLLVKSFAKLVHEYQQKSLKLMLSGRITNAKHEALNNLHNIINLTKKLQVFDQVIFLDYLSPVEKETLVKNCLFFVALSGYEGFGLGPLEAIKYHVPILSSKPGILASYQQPNFYLLDNLEIKTVVTKMKLLVDKVSNETDFNALIAFTNQFSWPKMAAQYYKLYQEMINA